MTITISEFTELARLLYPDAQDRVTLARIEGRTNQILARVDSLTGRVSALSGQEQQEITTMAEIDNKLTTVEGAVAQVGSDVAAEIDRLNALIAANQPVTAGELGRLDAIATSLQNIDAAAVAAGQPIAAPAPAGGDTTGGTTDPTGGTSVSGGTTDQTPVPEDGGAAPDTGTGTDGSAGGPAA